MIEFTLPQVSRNEKWIWFWIHHASSAGIRFVIEINRAVQLKAFTCENVFDARVSEMLAGEVSSCLIISLRLFINFSLLILTHKDNFRWKCFTMWVNSQLKQYLTQNNMYLQMHVFCILLWPANVCVFFFCVNAN